MSKPIALLTLSVICMLALCACNDDDSAGNATSGQAATEKHIDRYVWMEYVRADTVPQSPFVLGRATFVDWTSQGGSYTSHTEDWDTGFRPADSYKGLTVYQIYFNYGLAAVVGKTSEGHVSPSPDAIDDDTQYFLSPTVDASSRVVKWSERIDDTLMEFYTTYNVSGQLAEIRGFSGGVQTGATATWHSTLTWTGGNPTAVHTDADQAVGAGHGVFSHDYRLIYSSSKHDYGRTVPVVLRWLGCGVFADFRYRDIENGLCGALPQNVMENFVHTAGTSTGKNGGSAYVLVATYDADGYVTLYDIYDATDGHMSYQCAFHYAR